MTTDDTTPTTMTMTVFYRYTGKWRSAEYTEDMLFMDTDDLGNLYIYHLVESTAPLTPDQRRVGMTPPTREKYLLAVYAVGAWRTVQVSRG
jgi:hypothetical protein